MMSIATCRRMLRKWPSSVVTLFFAMVVATGSCSGITIRGNDGQFSSPNYPYWYPNNVNDTYTIRLNTPGPQQSWRFRERSAATVIVDYSYELQEKDSRTGECVDRIYTPAISSVLCGTGSTRYVLNLQGNKFIVNFETNGQHGRKGFNISYHVLQNTSEDTVVHGNTGTFLSPGYPSRYEHNLHLVYRALLSTPGPQQVRVDYTVRLEQRNSTENPCYDSIWIPETNWEQCGRSSTTTYMEITGDKFTLFFTTNDWIRKTGFNVTYTVIEGNCRATVDLGPDIDQWQLVPITDILTRNSLVLSVRTCAALKICLSRGSNPELRKHSEITIQPLQVSVRTCLGDEDSCFADKNGDFLDCCEFRSFWLHWNSSYVSIGHKETLSSNLTMFRENPLSVNFIHLKALSPGQMAVSFEAPLPDSYCDPAHTVPPAPPLCTATTNSPGNGVTASGVISSTNNAGDVFTTSGVISSTNNAGHVFTTSYVASTIDNTGNIVATSDGISTTNNPGYVVTTSNVISTTVSPNIVATSAITSLGNAVTTSDVISTTSDPGIIVTTSDVITTLNSPGNVITASDAISTTNSPDIVTTMSSPGIVVTTSEDVSTTSSPGNFLTRSDVISITINPSIVVTTSDVISTTNSPGIVVTTSGDISSTNSLGFVTTSDNISPTDIPGIVVTTSDVITTTNSPSFVVTTFDDVSTTNNPSIVVTTSDVISPSNSPGIVVTTTPSATTTFSTNVYMTSSEHPATTTHRDQQITATRDPAAPRKLKPCKCAKEVRSLSASSTSQSAQALKEKKKEMAEAIKKELIIQKGNVSATVRRKTTATDARNSSTYVGFVVGLVCFSPLVFIVVSDCLVLIARIISVMKTSLAKRKNGIM